MNKTIILSMLLFMNALFIQKVVSKETINHSFYEKGKISAKATIGNNNLKYITNNKNSVLRGILRYILETEYNIYLIYHNHDLNNESKSNILGYNEVMEKEFKKRFKKDIISLAKLEAKKTEKEKQLF